MIAGAGSGKTTSLVKALLSTLECHGKALRKNRQRIACITYTNIAAGEIWGDVGSNPLVHVSTIHSFLWTLASTFQSDIRDWVSKHIEEKIAELQEKAANFGPRVQARTREKNQRDLERYQSQREELGSVSSFRYGTGSDYKNGILGHDDVVKLCTHLILESPRYRTVVGQLFPFVFVDESQDTMPAVVESLLAIQRQMSAKFCLGFFGDPMQQIYATGVGRIALNEEWQLIEKPENFRCPTSVLAVANAIRGAGDGLVQTRGRTQLINDESQPVTGSARIFVLPADAGRNERLHDVRNWIAARNNDPVWAQLENVKVLVVVHRMAASRLGFSDLYAAMNDRAPEAFKSGFLDSTAWPLKPFLAFVLPLCQAIESQDEFEAMNILRTNSPLLEKKSLKGQDIRRLLERLRAASLRVSEMLRPDSVSTVREVLMLLRDAQLVSLDPRILAHLQLARPVNQAEDLEEDEESFETVAMASYLACPAQQFLGYRRYVSEESPFETQQGIKGAEFDRVLVVLDDDEGTHFQFSYDKFFGVSPLSPRDAQNRREGRDSVVERTRRLFYVCCTRALTDLAVVYFSADARLAEIKVRESGIFPPNAILTLGDLAA
jgi:DNA helicase II / ATP-dependent DNA helicase PcrA